MFHTGFSSQNSSFVKSCLCHNLNDIHLITANVNTFTDSLAVSECVQVYGEIILAYKMRKMNMLSMTRNNLRGIS